MSDTTTETTKPKKTKVKAKAASKPKAPKAPKAKPEKTKAQLAWAAAHTALTEKQLSEAREVVRLLPAVVKMAETYRTSTPARKTKYENASQVIEHLVVKAFNRQASLDRWHGDESKLVN